MWAQAMAEYGLMSVIAEKVSALETQVDAAIGNGGSRWVLIGGVVLLALWLFRRK